MAEFVELDADFFLRDGDRTVVAVVDPANGDALFFKNRTTAQRVLAVLEARDNAALAAFLKGRCDGRTTRKV
jgi:hypothetical protein